MRMQKRVETRVHQGYRWRKIAAKRKARAKAIGYALCGICGDAIDMHAQPRTSLAFSVDHIISIHNGGDPYDELNLMDVHYGCNASKKAGNVKLTKKPFKTSREW